MSAPKILIIIPAYNESGNIQRVVKEVLSLDRSLDILVVNDASTDTTEVQAKEAGVRVVTLLFNLGIGGAVQTGFLYAYKNDYDIAVQVDGDRQHDVGFLEDLINPIISSQADIVVGSRFVGKFLGYQSSFVRRMGIHFFAHLISFLTQHAVTDPTSGFRAYNKKAIKVFAHDYPSDYPEPESMVIASRQKLSLVEVPVKMRERFMGTSSIRYLNTLYYMVKVTLAILLDMVKKPKEEKHER